MKKILVLAAAIACTQNPQNSPAGEQMTKTPAVRVASQNHLASLLKEVDGLLDELEYLYDEMSDLQSNVPSEDDFDSKSAYFKALYQWMKEVDLLQDSIDVVEKDIDYVSWLIQASK